MMDKQHGDFIFCCDVCGKTLKTEQADFGVAINLMKRAGWSARKVGQDWVHGCDGCGDPVRGGEKGRDLL